MKKFEIYEIEDNVGLDQGVKTLHHEYVVEKITAKGTVPMVEKASERAKRHKKKQAKNTRVMSEGKSTGYTPCWASHPKLPITVDGTTYYVSGGSCTTMNDRIKEADIFIGLDSGMKATEKEFPWTPGIEFRYLITDMCAPGKPANFKAMIKWLAEQIIDGKNVHIGCIGGHGRTGLVLSALVAHMTGEKDAIQYVRKHYCAKAVESETQVKFLQRHFKVSKAEATKAHYSTQPVGGYTYPSKWNDPWTVDAFDKQRAGSAKPVKIQPVASKGSIYGGSV